MKPSKRTSGLAAALALLSTAAVAAVTPDEAGFRLMSEQEIADHAAAMATLEGAAREEYRNTQYRALRARAMEQGYAMPEAPPWAEAAPAAPQDPLAQHEAMRERLQAHRELTAAPPAVNEPPAASSGETGVPAAGATTAPEPAAAPAAVVAPAALPRQDARAEPAAAAAAQTPATRPSDGAAARQTPDPRVPQPAALEPQRQATPAAEAATASVDRDPADMPVQERPAASAGLGSEAMSAYRETMRARFDEYMRERQAQFEENVRRHREQREATLEQQPSRVAPPTPPNPPRMQPYGYPPAAGYGPRYPSGFPGYRTPYWQQNP